MSDPFAAGRLDGRIALITGAAQGIGEATARLLAARGAAGLLLTDRNEALGEAVAQGLRDAGTPAHFVAAELTDATQVAAIVPAALAAFGRLDILCNVAGNTERGRIEETDAALYDRVMDTNLRAPFFLMQAAIAAMQRQEGEGAIVNVISVNAYIGGANLAAYSTSKGGLMTLTRNTANAVNADRIRVNGIALGWVDTPAERLTQRGDGAGDDWLAKAEAKRPYGRLLQPDDVARMIAFLASDESRPMTGSIVDFEQTVVGGGR